MQHPFFAWLPHGTDLLWLFLLAVLLFGADKLPKLARGLGKSLGEFKKAKEEFEKEVHSASSETEQPQPQNLINGTVPKPITPVASPTASPVDELTKKS